MNTSFFSKLAALVMASVILLGAGCTNVREIGNVNGVKLTRVTTRGVFSPSSTTILAHNPETPGVVDVLANTGGPGLIPAVATAGGVVGGAALLRPATTKVTNNSGSTASGGSGGAGGTGNGGSGGHGSGGGFIPPGHINNPNQDGTPGNQNPGHGNPHNN